MNNVLNFLGGASLISMRPPEFFVPIIGIGMALVLFAFKESFQIYGEAEKLNKSIFIERKKFTESDIQYHRQRNLYFKFVWLVRKVGALYFISLCLILFLSSYPTPLPNPLPVSYVILYNFNYLCVFIPTVIICIYYFLSFILVSRLH
ncbi:MAG: hypothetical protein HQ536_04990 [Parcubacteria group bacterium]|nr:hypothetical protein [Parcubacteria group bacterium]